MGAYTWVPPPPSNSGKLLPLYTATQKKHNCLGPLEFPVFGGPNCSAGLGVREPRLSNPEFGLWSFQILGAPTVQEVWHSEYPV